MSIVCLTKVCDNNYLGLESGPKLTSGLGVAANVAVTGRGVVNRRIPLPPLPPKAGDGGARKMSPFPNIYKVTQSL